MNRIFIACLLFLCVHTTGIAQPSAGLVAYWPLNGNFTDNGPSSIVTTGSSVTPTTNKRGITNSAMLFSNPSSTVPSYGAAAVNSNINFTGNFSVSLGFMATSIPHAMGLFDNCLNHNGYGLWMWNSPGYNQVNFNCRNGNIGTTSAANLLLNTWYHIVCTRNGNTISLYVNGVLNATGTQGTGTPAYPDGARFGSMYYSGFSPPQYNGMNGKIDEVCLYNRVLTAAEILVLTTIVLPVNLKNFTATHQQGNRVLLNWQTATEAGIRSFSIQRSTDGVNFTGIGELPAAGNSTTEKDYRYTDHAVKHLQGTVYYRLDMIDKDGAHQYSSIVAVRLDSPGQPGLYLFPNPAKDFVQVTCPAGISGATRLKVTDMNGRSLIDQEHNLQTGTSSIPLKTGNLSPGQYIVTLYYKDLQYSGILHRL